MLARVLVFLVLAQGTEKFRQVVIEDVDEVEIGPQDTVEMISRVKAGSDNMWVIGRFPSNKIVPREGRLGDLLSDRKDAEGNRIQVFTITTTRGVHGDELPMDFWYIKPQYAEQYYNDPSAYEAMHDEKPKTKLMIFKVKNPEL